MFDRIKYRPITAGLLLLFTVFSVGIPVIVSSCPMMNSAGKHASCCAVRHIDVGKVQFENPDHCCQQPVMINRNTNEFIQGTTQYQAEIKSVTPLTISPATLANTPHSQFVVLALKELQHCRRTVSLFDDIPIIDASLLI